MPLDLYAPPRVAACDVARDAGSTVTTPPHRASLACLGASALSTVAALTIGRLGSPASLVALVVAMLLAIGGVVFAIGAGVRTLRRGRAHFALRIATAAFLAIANAGIGLFATLVVAVSTMSFARGRQLRRFGKVLLPRVARSTPANDWTAPRLDPRDVDLDGVLRDDGVDVATRLAVAGQWRENGRTEHASVAAFARLTLDLIGLGGPPELVAAAQQDALDEIRHAELCFALARAIDRRSESPCAFPEAARTRSLARVRRVALAELAVHSLIDGALHEGVSARVAAKLSRRAVDPAIRAVLKRIAADEGRHAAHAWDIVRWCLAEGGAPVAHALASAARALPTAMRSSLPTAAASGGWERFGIMSVALASDEYACARANVIRRVEDLVRSERDKAARRASA